MVRPSLSPGQPGGQAPRLVDLSLQSRPDPAGRLITFLSDFGVDDEFVGVCHAVIHRIAPGTQVIDLGHGHRGVRAGAAALAQAAPFVPPGAIHLAVVDPGVGTARRAVVVVCGSNGCIVAPDNGLAIWAAERLGGVVAVYELADPNRQLQPVSATFHGRDVFAPAAALVAAGEDPSEFGPSVDAATLVTLPEPDVRSMPGRLLSDVLRVDRFGNVQLAATRDDLDRAGLGPRVLVVCEAGSFPAVLGRTFGDGPDGGLVVHVDSAGQVAVALRGGDACARLGMPGRVAVETNDGAGAVADGGGD